MSSNREWLIPRRQAEGEAPAGWFYFVHYNGWNKKYDTWVEDAGLIKMPQGSELGPPVRAGRFCLPIVQGDQDVMVQRPYMLSKRSRSPSIDHRDND